MTVGKAMTDLLKQNYNYSGNCSVCNQPAGDDHLFGGSPLAVCDWCGGLIHIGRCVGFYAVRRYEIEKDRVCIDCGQGDD